MMNKFLLSSFLLICLLLATTTQAQNTVAGIGQWRSHLAHQNAHTITESDDAVFFGSDQAVIKVYKDDVSFEYLNKVVGLSDMGVQVIEYYKAENVLVIAYTNGNIDLLYDNGSIANLSAIKTNSNIVGNKEIYHIFCQDRKIYFSCAFGLVVYDMDLESFKETVFTQTSVSACTQSDNALYISTASGIYKGLLDGRNLQDFAVWQKQNQIAGYTTATDYRSRSIIKFGDKIYADYNDTLIYYENGNWQHLTGTFDGAAYTAFNPINTRTDYLSNYNLTTNYNGDALLIATFTGDYYSLNTNNEIERKGYNDAWRIQDLVIDQDGLVWAADMGGMRRDFKLFRPNSPQSNVISDLHADSDGTLWLSSSPYNTYQAYFNRNGYAKYQDGQWKIYNSENGYNALDNFFDCNQIVKNEVDGNVYVGSYMSGLVKMDEQENITVYNESDLESTLTYAIGDRTVRVVGVTVDEQGNTWMANSLTNAPVAVRKRNGEWKSILIAKLGDQKTEQMDIDRNGYLWVKQITGRVVVFDPGNIDDDTDDRSIVLGESNTILPSNNINCLVKDKNGVMWLGTDQGISIFNCSSTIFDGGCTGNRPIIEQDNFNGYLLEAENVLDIAVDGANRKWVATENGLFLLSDDGEEQIYYFTEDNSPLFDNEIKHLAVEGKTGTVYIATGRGLQSFRNDATLGAQRMKSADITIFPHPVRPEYDGPIAISNLADEANVKITDISGRLMYETTALGGQAIWNGKDYNGRKAQTGVYLVFVVNENGEQKGVGKIMFIN